MPSRPSKGTVGPRCCMMPATRFFSVYGPTVIASSLTASASITSPPATRWPAAGVSRTLLATQVGGSWGRYVGREKGFIASNVLFSFIIGSDTGPVVSIVLGFAFHLISGYVKFLRISRFHLVAIGPHQQKVCCSRSREIQVADKITPHDSAISSPMLPVVDNVIADIAVASVVPIWQETACQ